MNEVKLVGAALKSRQAWEMMDGQIRSQDISPEGSSVWEYICRFYETDVKAEKCDAEIIEETIKREVQSNKNADLIAGYLGEANNADVSAINVAKELLGIKQAALGMKIATKLASGRVHADVGNLMHEYIEVQTTKEQADKDETISGVLASDLVAKHYNNENLIKLWPEQLNAHIDGGVRGGHHILVFAPTEMGKTLFNINLCAGFLKQKLRVLYVGNEDPAADIQMRMINRLTGMNKYEVQANPRLADKRLSKRGWDKFILADLSPGTFGKISQLVKRTKADVVVLDQLRNIDVDTEQRTQSLERAATEARNLAKRFNIPVISVTQAGDSASGKIVLRRGDVDGSNVGIPGQCDLMIGIGATDEMEGNNTRMLSFPKNKLSGRHNHFSIKIDPLLSLVVEPKKEKDERVSEVPKGVEPQCLQK